MRVLKTFRALDAFFGAIVWVFPSVHDGMIHTTKGPKCPYLATPRNKPRFRCDLSIRKVPCKRDRVVAFLNAEILPRQLFRGAQMLRSTESAEETLALRGPLAPAGAFTGGFVVLWFASDLRD